jgi:hypothetical protein
MSLRNGSHLPTTQCACADFVDFAMQRNGRPIAARQHDQLNIKALGELPAAYKMAQGTYQQEISVVKLPSLRHVRTQPSQ